MGEYHDTGQGGKGLGAREVEGARYQRALRQPLRGAKKEALSVFFADTFDVRAHTAQLFDDALVATVDVINAVDDGLAAGDQAGKDQASARAQIGSLHSST